MERFLSNRKRSAKVVLGILLSFLILGLSSVLVIWAYRELHARSYFYDISRSLRDLEAYETVANFCLEYSTKNPRNGFRLFETYEDQLNTRGDNREYIKVSLSEQEKELVKTVDSGFVINSSSLFPIIVSDHYVSFCAEQELAAIIYSPDDTKPNFIRYSGEEVEYSILFNVVKIADHWYFACN